MSSLLQSLASSWSRRRQWAWAGTSAHCYTDTSPISFHPLLSPSSSFRPCIPSIPLSDFSSLGLCCGLNIASICKLCGFFEHPVETLPHAFTAFVVEPEWRTNQFVVCLFVLIKYQYAKEKKKERKAENLFCCNSR